MRRINLLVSLPQIALFAVASCIGAWEVNAATPMQARNQEDPFVKMLESLREQQQQLQDSFQQEGQEQQHDQPPGMSQIFHSSSNRMMTGNASHSESDRLASLFVVRILARLNRSLSFLVP